MQQNQALRRSHDEELATLRAQLRSRWPPRRASWRTRSDGASARRARRWTRCAAGCRRRPLAARVRRAPAAVGSWTSPPSTPPGRARPAAPSRRPRERGGVDARGGDAPRARERAAGVGGGAARVAVRGAAGRERRGGRRVHSQQLLATRCHALAQRVQSQQDELERGRSRLTELEAMLEHAEQQATTEEQRASRLEATHAALEAAPTAAPSARAAAAAADGDRPDGRRLVRRERGARGRGARRLRRIYRGSVQADCERDRRR